MTFIKKHAYTILFSTLLLGANTYALLKTFVIPSALSQVVTAETSATDTDTTALSSSNFNNATITDSTYEDGNIAISITTSNTGDTAYYVADIQLSSAEYLKTALAQNTFGTNITATTSSIASSNNAIFAVNGDYYGANEVGYVIKNGVVYRDSSRNSDYEDLAVYADGSFATFNEADTSVQELVDSGVVNTFAFGPTLISNGEITVSASEEVGRAMSDNPRTAIGIIEEDDGSLHYIIIVSDGRSDASAGLTLYELAEIMQSYGVTTAYNLDGGGSSTMYFNGEIINNPTTNGNTIKERAVSDIVYIGY